MSNWNTLIVDVADRVAVVTLNRPPVNAQNAEMRDELTALFDELSDRDDVMAVVLTGSGKVFSAGADIRERPNLGDTPGAYGRHNRLVRESYYAVVECSKPVIAAINGPAMGAGFQPSTAPKRRCSRRPRRPRFRSRHRSPQRARSR